jgi:hypothetical protein
LAKHYGTMQVKSLIGSPVSAISDGA